MFHELTVLCQRETTTLVAGVLGSDVAVTTGKEVLHSPELAMDVEIREADPRVGMRAREIEDLVRAEPDARKYGSPRGYEVFDNRPVN